VHRSAFNGSYGFFLSRMRKVEEALAKQMEFVLEWDIRLDTINRLPHVFPATCTGNIDTFPVYIERPKAEMQGATYSGKYKSCVLKVFLSSFSAHLFYVAVDTSGVRSFWNSALVVRASHRI